MKTILLSFSLVFWTSWLLAAPLKISQVLPAGKDISQTRQITFKFNKKVVPLGRMERKDSEVPITITPKVKCDWRWIDPSTLACQLGSATALKLATKYKIKVKPEFKTTSGEKLKKGMTHTFITGRPKTGYISFETWKAPGKPVIRVSFNQPVGKKSVKKSIYFKIQGKKKRIKVNVAPIDSERESPRYIWVPGEPYFIYVGDNKKQKSNEEIVKKKGEAARSYWLVEPVKDLPLDTTISLFESPGLMSAFGKEKGVRKKVIKRFETFPEFKFIGVDCRNEKGRSLFFSAKTNKSINPGKCNPVGGGVTLEFSSPVLKEQMKGNIKFSPDLAGGRKDYDPWEESYSWSRLRSAHRKGSNYSIRLPRYLKAETTYNITGGENIKDEFGRSLKTPINMYFQTDKRKPNWEIPHRRAIIEQGIDTDVPIFVTNMDTINYSYEGLTAKGKLTNKKKTYNPDIPKDIAAAIPMELKKLLGNKSGAVFGSISSSPSVQKYNKNVFAQMTNYQVVVKYGHYNTLVWVTDMRNGKNVDGASVEVLKGSYTKLGSLEQKLKAKNTNQDGISVFKGVEELDPELDYKHVWEESKTRYFIKVSKNDEMALLPLDSNFEVDTYRITDGNIYGSHERKYGHLKAWGMTAQGVYKLGDKIQFKIYIRDQNVNTFKTAPKESYSLKVNDPMGKSAFELDDIKLNEFGAFHGEFTTSKSAAMGWYSFVLTTKLGGRYNHTLHPLKVLVTDFTPSSFRVGNTVNGERFEPGDKISIGTSAKLHSGGPYIDAESRVTIRLNEERFSPKHPISSKFTFQPYISYPRNRQIFQNSKKIDNKGESSDEYELTDQKIQYGKLYIESAVRDDRGKYIASGKSATYIGVDRFVGLRNTKWTYNSGRDAEIEFIVTDPSGKPVEDVPVKINVEYKKTSSSRVKGSGNAYVTKYTTEMVKVASCEEESDDSEEECEFEPEKAGEYKITATIKDTKGRTHSSSIWAWVTGSSHVVWESPESNTLTIIPESESYKVGDTAQYLIKNPFPKGKALITLERYGVIKQWVQEFKTSTPVIKFKVTEDLIPGFYFSVTVISPRVDKSKGFGKLDLGKPTFRTGYIEVPVKDQYKDIVVSSKSDKEVYKPRDKAKITLSAKEKVPKKKQESHRTCCGSY